jgi:hypothetical protein
VFQSNRHRPLRRVTVAVLAAVVLLAAAPLESAPAASPPQISDSVRTWNAHAAAALFNGTTATIPGAGQTPPVGALHMAMTQLAVYDAVNSIHRGYEPYLDGLPHVPKSASLDAAVATAAHHVLVGLGITPVPIDPVPALPQVVRDRLDVLYADALAAIPPGSAKDAGIAAGEAAAAAMLAERNGDGRYVPFSFTEGTDPGEWRAGTNGSDPFAWVGNVEPFTLKSTSQFRTKGPFDLRSWNYAKEYNEVKAFGSLTGSSRTQEQTDLALFYTANPVEMYNRAFRDVTVYEGLGVVDEARFFAQVNVSGADAMINCWDDKEYWHFWRPSTAIRNGDADGNRRTAGDPAWTPLSGSLPDGTPNNPPYPDHPSGYNCVTGAFMHAAKRFLGNSTDLRITNLALGVTREYQRFLDVPKDTIVSRMYLGIHFLAPNAQGADLGARVARWVDTHYFEQAH